MYRRHKLNKSCVYQYFPEDHLSRLQPAETPHLWRRRQPPVSRLLKAVNRPGGAPCHIYIDEFVSFHSLGMDVTLATCREHKVWIFLGIQTLDQVRKEYGRDHADALFNLPANLICSQVFGDSAKYVSDRVGKILQEKSTISTSPRNSSTSHSLQLDPALPPSKIATLSSGEFVGITADSPDQPIPLKAFHCHITLEQQTLQAEAPDNSRPSPSGKKISQELIDFTFRQIKADVKTMIQTRLEYMKKSPDLAPLSFPPRSVPAASGNHLKM
jgi:hypothetical protein